MNFDFLTTRFGGRFSLLLRSIHVKLCEIFCSRLHQLYIYINPYVLNSHEHNVAYKSC